MYAALTSEDFIYYRDFMTGLEPPFYNPGNRTMKYYYWANAMIGVNPAANCVLFTTEDATAIPTITMTPSGLAFTNDTVDVELGGTVKLGVNLTGTITEGENSYSGSIAVEPDSALFEVAATRTTKGTGDDPDVTIAVPLNSRTYVDAYGVLHVQKTGLQVGDVITVTATSTWVNPSGVTSTFSNTAAATVIAPVAHGAKECAVATDPYITYTDVTEEVTASE